MRDGERNTARMVPDTHLRNSTSLARSEQPTMQAQHRSQHTNQGNSKIATSSISANEMTSSTVNGLTTTTNTTATTVTAGVVFSSLSLSLNSSLNLGTPSELGLGTA
jgi:hypothetical protein